jgi:hypothetical protein
MAVFVVASMETIEVYGHFRCSVVWSAVARLLPYTCMDIIFTYLKGFISFDYS